MWGIKLYNVQYGWADYDGKKLEMPFYLGDADFKTDINSKNISFASFVIKDKENTIFLGDPSFVRCMTDDLKFTIPNGYNPDIHKNIAKFTNEFLLGEPQTISLSISLSYFFIYFLTTIEPILCPNKIIFLSLNSSFTYNVI